MNTRWWFFAFLLTVWTGLDPVHARAALLSPGDGTAQATVKTGSDPVKMSETAVIVRTQTGLEQANTHYFVEVSSTVEDILPTAVAGSSSAAFILTSDTNTYLVTNIYCNMLTTVRVEIASGTAQTTRPGAGAVRWHAQFSASSNTTAPNTNVQPTMVVMPGQGLWVFEDKTTTVDPDDMITMRACKLK